MLAYGLEFFVIKRRLNMIKRVLWLNDTVIKRNAWPPFSV